MQVKAPVFIAAIMWSGLTLSTALAAQSAPAAPVQQQAPLPPATKLEGFKPSAGSIVTLGYNNLGSAAGVSVDVREIKDAHGNAVRGLVVDVDESEYRQERSFVDADEIPELLRGIDALLAVNANPTNFDQFEVRYTTKGALELTAFNSGRNIKFAVQAGRTLHAQRFLDEGDMKKLRSLVEAAQTRLAQSK